MNRALQLGLGKKTENLEISGLKLHGAENRFESRTAVHRGKVKTTTETKQKVAHNPVEAPTVHCPVPAFQETVRASISER